MTHENTSYPSFYFVQGIAKSEPKDEFGAMRNMLWDIAQGVAAKNQVVLMVQVVPDEDGARICEVSGSDRAISEEEALKIGNIVVTTWNSAHAVMYGSEPNATHFDSVLPC